MNEWEFSPRRVSRWLMLVSVTSLAGMSLAATTSPRLAAPTELNATAVSPTRIDLRWTDNSDNESAFVVERRAAGAAAWSLVWDQNNASFPSFSDMGLTPGARYEYRVKARAKDGAESETSNTAAATTPAGRRNFNNRLRDCRAWAGTFQWRKVPAYQAVDGTQWTRWWSKLSPENAPRTDWLCVDMGSRQAIDKVRIIWQRDWWARRYEVHTSDDAEHWRTVLAVENAAFEAIEERSFPAATGRYVRFWGIESANTQQTWGGYGSYSLYEFEAYAPGEQPDALEWESSARQQRVIATTRPELARGAVDGHMGTFWSARHGRENHLTVDLGAERDIHEIQPCWHVPVDAYRLEVSIDGEAWRKVADQGSVRIVSVENEEIREIHTASFSPPLSARHVRLVITGRAITKDPIFAQVILQELLVHSVPAGAPRAK